jgi:hypothetical protein
VSLHASAAAPGAAGAAPVAALAELDSVEMPQTFVGWVFLRPQTSSALLPLAEGAADSVQLTLKFSGIVRVSACVDDTDL